MNKLPLALKAVFALFFVACCWGAEQTESLKRDYFIKPVPFNHVHVDDAFWTPRLETNRKVTLPYTFGQCEDTGRIANFEKAAGLRSGEFEGIYFNDSDVYKIMEGAAYSLQVYPDRLMRLYLDQLIQSNGRRPVGGRLSVYLLLRARPATREIMDAYRADP